MKAADFSYYKPANKKQEEFHQSKAMHKLLIGGYRGGKTYPTIHEVFMFCYEQGAGCEFGVFRNTWDSLMDNVEKDMVEVGKAANAYKKWDKTKHNMTLWNDVVIKFRPLTMSRKQFKGMNLCGFFIDDPDEYKYADIIGFLFTRLTNPPMAKAAYFATFICANYEGHGWLWKTYIKNRREGGDDTFAYWILQTQDNPTLHDGYIETLSAIHSKSWMDRYVNGNIESYSGIVYDEYDANIHDKNLSWCDKAENLIKITATDVGITHPTVTLNMATDLKKIYIYNELYKTNMRTQELAFETKKIRAREAFRDHVIDPSAAKTEQTSGTSVKKDLWDRFKLKYNGAQNSKLRGIEIVKSLLTPRNAKGEIDLQDGEPTLYIDPVRCPNLVREIEMYHWKEPEMTDFDELAYKEEPVKKDDDCMDSMKYGAVRLVKFLKGMMFMQKLLKNERDELWKNRREKLKIYQNSSSMSTAQRDRLRINTKINNRVKAHEKKMRERKRMFERLNIS